MLSEGVSRDLSSIQVLTVHLADAVTLHSSSSDCTYLHRLPPSDLVLPDASLDVFGREKWSDYRDDMVSVVVVRPFSAYVLTQQ